MRITGAEVASQLVSTTSAKAIRHTTEFSEPSPALEPDDELSLSPESQSLADAIAGSKTFSLEQGPNSPGEDFFDRYQKNLHALQARLDREFAARNIDNSRPIQLETGVDGHVIAPNHPQQAEIEAIFADAPELRNLFVKVDSDATMLQAAADAVAFQAAYRRNPDKALQEFARLFDPAQSKQFSLQFKNGLMAPVLA